ncbi:hypothetical protein DFP91_1052 [Pseudorhodoplanes sinuspersici]|nr:hypothetical protein DFP91_1052 [Pseudorhodoplanes sinuspersici]
MDNLGSWRIAFPIAAGERFASGENARWLVSRFRRKCQHDGFIIGEVIEHAGKEQRFARGGPNVARTDSS